MDSTPGPAARSPRYPSHHRVARRVEPTVSTDLRAAMEARRELGPEYEGELIDGFLDHLDQAIDARVDARLAEARGAQPPAKRGIDGSQLALGIVTMALAIPLTAVPLAFSAEPLVLIIWIGIVVVNLAAALSRRR